MELVNVDAIFIAVLVVFLFITIFIPFARPIYRSVFLFSLSRKNDYSKFVNTVDTYIEKSKSEREKNIFRLKKIDGMILFQQWTEVKDIINSTTLNFSTSSIIIFCDTILNLYISDRPEEARIFISKIDMQNEKVRNNIGVRLCIAINDYFNNDLIKSKQELEELSNMQIKYKYHAANISYYLGLIAIQENDIMKSKNYFNSVMLFPQKCTLVDKASKIINDISKE